MNGSTVAKALIALLAALVTLFSQSASDASTRARSRAETVLNDSSVRISAGAGHTCQVKEDGTVRCWGANNVGQLGNGLLGNGIAANEPTRIPTLVMTSPTTPLTSVVAIAAAGGGGHTCALLAGGTVRCWGANGNGQLGNDALTNRLNPVAVVGITTAVAISAGTSHTCALLADGTVRCWGSNFDGQLGIGTGSANRLTPVTVVTSPNNPLTNVVAIAAGHFHTCALLANGHARCWGANNFGQIGIGAVSAVDHPTPVEVVTSPNSALTTVVAIAAGRAHTCALLASGIVRCWGDNGNGQIGNNSTSPALNPVTVRDGAGILINAVSITVGNAHTCALLGNGVGRCSVGGITPRVSSATEE